jgi:CheY-like chemotaxis protein
VNILLVEDDHLEEELIRKSVEGELQRRNVVYRIIVIRTEKEFHDKVEMLIRGVDRPHLAIMDVMMPWTDIDEVEEARPTEEARRDGPFRAGLRCAERLHSLAPEIPVVLYTILDRADLDGDIVSRRKVEYVRKDDDNARLVGRLNQHVDRFLKR